MAKRLSRERLFGKPDWLIILLYFVLITFGWLNIYAAVYDAEAATSIFDMSLNSGRQLVWIVFTLVMVVLPLLLMNYNVFSSFAWGVYIVMMLLLILTLLVGKEVAGSKSWLGVGSFAIQPSEFAKFATALALAKYLDKEGNVLSNFRNVLVSFLFLLIPAGLILLQNDTGSTLVYASFIILLYRAGLTPIIPTLGISAATIFVLTLMVENLYLYIGIGILGVLLVLFLPKKSFRSISLAVLSILLVGGVVRGVDYFVNNLLKPHQQNRIKALINPEADPLGYGWNVTQSKIAIGSGGLTGKGFLEGTQTKFDFVPEQSTDFIFCTIGEEHGWLGSSLVVILFVFFLLRLVYMAERQRSRFARLYGYGVIGVFFFHFMVNIGMTIGLMPVIGIPLPFFSYGGSSFLAFSVLLFIFIKLDAHRMHQMRWNRYF